MHVLYIYTDPTNPESSELIFQRAYGALYADSTTNRPALKALLQNIAAGDTLHIASVTHLGADDWEAIRALQTLANKGSRVVAGGSEVPVQAYAPITLQTVRAFKAFRNIFTQRRARQGTRKAVKSGVKVGRPTKPLPAGFEEAARKWYDGETTSIVASASIGMPFSTFVKKARNLLGKK